MKFIFFVLLVTACSGRGEPPPYRAGLGELGGPCRVDGTCLPPLTCEKHSYDENARRTWSTIHYVDYNTCEQPQPDECHGKADCFCRHCLLRCGLVGMKKCAFGNDTWGAGPDICECQQ